MKLYAPKGMWLNDPKIILHKGEYHLFHLQGARVATWQQLAGQKESYGHAVSDDGIHWEPVKTALRPGKKGTWDDRGTWSGDFLKKDGLYYLLYTGVCSEDKLQRLGLARSRDLVHWEKFPGNPVSQPDPRYYENDPDNSPGYNHVAWRDPGVRYDARSGWVYAYVCARLNHGRGKRRGCVGLIRSRDMIHWQVLPPVYAPRRERYHEVPQVIRAGNRYLLFFGAKIATGEVGCPSATKCVSSNNPFHWRSDAKVYHLIGGQPKTEYCAYIYPKGRGHELIHLTYETSSVEPRGYVRGRASLPKRLSFKGLAPYAALRSDLKPRTGENLALFHDALLRLDGRNGWTYQPRRRTLTCETGSHVAPLILGTIRDTAVRLALTCRGKVQPGVLLAGDRKASTGKCILPCDRSGHVLVRDLETGARLDYGRAPVRHGKRCELVLIPLGEHAEIYLNDAYMGTVKSLAPARKYLGLEVTGQGTLTVNTIGLRPLRARAPARREPRRT